MPDDRLSTESSAVPAIDEVLRVWAAGDASSAAELAHHAVAARGGDSGSPDHTDLLCRLTVAARRADLLPNADVVARLPWGAGRQAGLSWHALRDGDLPEAVGRLRGLAGEQLDEIGAVATLTMLRDTGRTATTVGDWTTAAECVELAADCLSLVRRPDPGLVFDLRAVRCATEWHTHAGLLEHGTLAADLGRLRNRNRLTAAHALALVEVAAVDMSRGDLLRADIDLTRAASLTRSTDPHLHARARAASVLVRMRQGHWDAAQSALDQVSDSGSAEVGAARALLAAFGRGAVTEGVPLPEDEDSVSVTTAQIQFHLDVLRSIGQHRWEELRLALDNAVGVGHRSTLRAEEWQALRALADWHTRRISEVRRRVGAWGAGTDATESAYYWAFQAILAEHDGRIAEGADSVKHASAKLHADMDPLGRAWVQMVCGTYLTRHGRGGLGDAVAGMASYEEARQILSGLDARQFLILCDRIIAVVTTELRAARSPDPAAVLTAPQLRVARLVADGYTSTEIAGMLHVARGTVDFHVANILRRLSLDNRRQIRNVLL